MINQTEFVDNLKKRMNDSFNSKFYLESITCSYAIIENRTKRICEHLGKCTKNMNLSEKTEYIYNSIKNKDLENDKRNRKLISFLKYRFQKIKLLNYDFVKEYKDLDKKSSDHQLLVFRLQRNDIMHDMYSYDSNNPKLINFEEDYAELASMGIYVANELCRIASAMKAKKKTLKLAYINKK